MNTKERTNISKNPSEVASRVGYLIGVPLDCVSKSAEWVSTYKELSRSSRARFVRNLCIIRTRLMNGVSNKQDKELSQAIEVIENMGITCSELKKGNLNDRIFLVSSILNLTIQDCKNLFPVWVNFKYISDLFCIPNGDVMGNIKKERKKYSENRLLYPYQAYIHWNPVKKGNILYDDSVLVPLMYSQHGETFTNISKVTDASKAVKKGIYSFIGETHGTVIVVDCENSDPYKMCAALQRLDNTYMSRVSKIILINDKNAASAWSILRKYTSIPVEENLVKRIKKDKSLVDIALSTTVCREHYQNNVNSFILFSSDSDFWGLTSTLPDVKFLFMLERVSTADEYKEALHSAGIGYCYLDDFYTGNTDKLKFDAVSGELSKLISKSLSHAVNLEDLLGKAAHSARVPIAEADRASFLEKYIERVSLTLNKDGAISVNSTPNG